jgi:hypothetical protein
MIARLRHLHPEHELLAPRIEVRRLPFVRRARLERVVRADRHVDFFLVVPVSYRPPTSIMKPVDGNGPTILGSTHSSPPTCGCRIDEQILFEYRCHEGNDAMAGALHDARYQTTQTSPTQKHD